MRVKVLQNVFRGGELNLKKDAELDLDGESLATALRRGYVEKAPAKAADSGEADKGKKGKKAE